MSMFKQRFLMEYYFPENFFGSVPDSKDSSMSEKMAKAILSVVFNISEEKILRGEVNKKEPDFIIDRQGYEVTFVCRNEYIQSFKKKSGFTTYYTYENIEKTLNNAIFKKNKKNYSIPTNLVLFVLEPYIELYDSLDISFEFDVINDETGDIYSKNDFFVKSPVYGMYEKIYEMYINKSFKNVFILMFDIDSTYRFIDIKKFIEIKNDKEAIKKIGRKKILLPYCQVVNIENIDSFK